ncbi:hypothetical protein SNE40_015525 [Patella caerulea]|uniref:Uncharacterized protein n=1 Tax=Patella caerulea TaxID=87958 RepID=A0AAN8JFV7_PATCE
MDDEDTGSNSSSPVPGDGEASPLFEKKKISYHSLDIRDTETVSAASTTLTLPEFRPTPDEVLFRMKYGHLNKGVDWIDYIENTAGPEETKWSLQLKIRDHLRDQPLSMAEKMMLQRYLQHQEVLKAVTTKQKRTEHHVV